MNPRTSARDVDAGVNDIPRKLWRRFLENHFDRIADAVEVVLNRFIDNRTGHLHLDGETADHVSPHDNHGPLPPRNAGAKLLFHTLCSLLTNHKIVLALHMRDNGFVNLVPAGMQQVTQNKSPQGDH